MDGINKLNLIVYFKVLDFNILSNKQNKKKISIAVDQIAIKFNSYFDLNQTNDE